MHDSQQLAYSLLQDCTSTLVQHQLQQHQLQQHRR
jgi:hypothetical protein